MRYITLFFIACAAVLLVPGEALAWGPGVHMVTGNWVLQNLTTLPPFVAEALMRYPGFFLQGCLSADIFIGKGSVAKEGHSHNWESAFALLARAEKLRDKAYAYGYLAHLAADTVAHNVFVPELFAAAPGAGRFAHIYLEAQADTFLSWDSADARGVFRQKGSRRATRLLRETMHQNAFQFWLKTHMFEGSILVGGSRAWRASVRLLDRMLPEPERRQFLDRMLVFSTRAIISLLTDMEKSPVLGLDPIGANALALAERRRDGGSVFLRGVKGSFRSVFFRNAENGYSQTLSGAGRDKPGLTERLPEPVIAIPDILLDCPPVCVPDKDTRL